MFAWLRRRRARWRSLGRGRSLAEEYERIARQIDPRDLQSSGEGWDLTDADLLGDLTGARSRSTRVSNYYSKKGLEYALERYGLLRAVRERGFEDLRLSIDPSDPQRQHITLHGCKDGEEHLLIDLMMGRIRKRAPRGLEPPEVLELLSIEWTMLQDPTRSFSADHPRWPGQDHPGLGLNEEVMLLHIQSAKRLELDGVVNHPSRYHVAFIGRDLIFFLDPELQGRFDALREALSPFHLCDAAWKMERGDVRWADDGTEIEWLPEDYVVPTSDRLAAYFRSPLYEEARAESYERATRRGISVGANPEREDAPRPF